MRPGLQEAVTYGNQKYAVSHWRELIESELTPEAHIEDSYGVLYQYDGYRYLAAWPEPGLLQAMLSDLCRDAAVNTVELPFGLRLRQHGNLCFGFNYGPEPVDVPRQITLSLFWARCL